MEKQESQGLDSSLWPPNKEHQEAHAMVNTYTMAEMTGKDGDGDT